MTKFIVSVNYFPKFTVEHVANFQKSVSYAETIAAAYKWNSNIKVRLLNAIQNDRLISISYPITSV